ncbi:hypothetical protein Z946_3244 [Sulfitobacter noctilucicola]|uniref:Uncharacterized protein n=1 Tax=Sulfitobacter noctilucicola TaxID=1342301 RepID=A0A7W6MAJ9_9RHOB|nr:hypothetical protein [Sulfitobacter noctilucicola]KIN64353.1 hypothetical protein Z946_3244 [Sulfitobacter noctilucicola]MBB4174486.1 hypothetical protein [Sulfitobacter noctilucicola]
MDFDVWIGPVIIAAGIAGVVNVLGWFVTGRRARLANEQRRREKQDDIATALLAEITHYRDALTFFDLDEVWESVANEMAENEDYMPFIPSERNDTIFTAIVGEIHVLPEDVIQPVTRYYNQVFAIDAIIDDLRSTSFRQEPYRTRIAVYTDYMSLKKQAIEDGNSAIKALSAHLSVSGARPALTKDRAR